VHIGKLIVRKLLRLVDAIMNTVITIVNCSLYSPYNRCASSRTVPRSIPVDITGFFSDIFLPTAPRPWGRLSP